jgi:hypothetical protein
VAQREDRLAIAVELERNGATLVAPSISVNDLAIPSPYDPKTYIIRYVSLRWPCITAIKVSRDKVEFILPPLHRGQLGPVQGFKLKHIRTGFGLRHAFICDCGRPVIKLYHLHRHLACRRCQYAIYASQALSKSTRPVLQVSRIASFLDSKSKLYRRSRKRLRKRLGEKLLMAQGKLGTEARSLWE